MIANRVTKIVQPGGGAAVLALFLAASVHAQNVGIGFTSPASKLTVNGNFAVGTDYNLVAPTNGALIEGFTCIGATAPDPGATGANDPYLTVASNGNANITLRPSTSAPNTRAGIFFGDNTYLECTDSTTNGNKDLTFFNVGTQANVLTLTETNWVGIDTTTPVAPLQVLPNTGSVTRGAGDVSNLEAPGVTTTTGNAAATLSGISIYANGSIATGANVFAVVLQAAASYTASDIRTKDVIGISDSAKDLETLNKLKITDYTMKDKSLLGDKPFKKVIAQDVEAVFPQAVREVVKSIPDIMEAASATQISKGEFRLLLPKPSGLKAGDLVEVFNKDRTPEVAHIKSVAGNAIDVALRCVRDGEKVFVYGHEVNNFGIVDYDALSMLNVSATQELTKRVEALEQENAHLRTETKSLTAIEKENAQLRADNAKLATDMEALKKAVASMQRKENGLERAVLKQ